MPEPGLRFTAPHDYARLLRRAHELVIAGASRPEIPARLVASWQRSMALGISPDQHSPRHLHEPAEVPVLRRSHRLQAVLPALTDLLADDGPAGRHLLIVTDARGEVLWRIGSRPALRRADSLEFVEGADWSEAGIGTNAISEALATGGPVQLFSAEHLVRTHHDWACTAAPIRDPLNGEVLGVLDVSGPLETVTADSLRMVRCGVRVAEELLARQPAPAAANRLADPVRPAAGSGAARDAVAALELLGEQPAVLLADGSRKPLTLRRAEILVLLQSRRQGFSADELAYELYGEAGSPATVRIEMHRIRSALGSFIDSHPYRLNPRAASDAGRILELLRAGHVGDAVAAYTAPLLSRSTALAVEQLREELNSAVGAAVRASGSADALARWLATDMGAGDTDAVAALGRVLGTGDPRYLAFRARADRLDRALRG
nr:GAF domain-containing protein [Arthrobacter mobilis]